MVELDLPVASSVTKKATSPENAQLLVAITRTRDHEMTMEEMEVATRDKNLMMRTTRITMDGDLRFLKLQFQARAKYYY